MFDFIDFISVSSNFFPIFKNNFFLKKIRILTLLIYAIVFYFLLPVRDRESIAFVSNFRNGNFDGFKYFEVP